ncbi:hypothetical protein [Thioalkalivibrio sp. XN8]|uniref:hypothetical protein n=1 Tax=Thioalkalivibrio sp. XN8 TaxID=2712863 RepID=UPI0013ED7A41|nr:hypothetical protein [Thioalkalivibrio sp. XN8]NGP54791.1 hypothetical protein [Thioalkalivibrio sp. XN8]
MNIMMKTMGRMVLLGCAMLFSAMVWAAPPAGVGGGGGNRPPGGEETQGNNLSFPAFAVDGYAIAEVETTTFDVVYSGEYPGLTPEEIAEREAGGPWYAQKTEGNTWQAEYFVGLPVEVSYVDWGDNIEAVDPKVRRPFRLEIQLYKRLAEIEEGMTMTGYVMAELEYPSSANELQGTNTATYEGNFATVVSDLWKLRVQYCGSEVPGDLYWDTATSMWLSPASSCADVPISFAVELNVGGKLIFGGSQGGWKPASAGFYRITFYSPVETSMSLATAAIGNYGDFGVVPPEEPAAAESDDGDEGAATPVVDHDLNLSYVDVQAVAGGGGGGGKPKAPKSNNGKKGLNK